MKDPQGDNIYCLPVNGDQWCEKMDKPQNKKERVGNTAELSDRKQTRRTSVKQQKYIKPSKHAFCRQTCSAQL